MRRLGAGLEDIKIGHWTDRKAATGCTVILCEKGAVAGVDVRGASPGTRETDLCRPINLVERVHAVLLSGGSAFGLNAAGGVMRYLEERGIGYKTAGGVVPIVPAAVLFDLAIGNPPVRPGPDEAYRACVNARSLWPEEGCTGAGTGAMVGQLFGPSRATKSGLGVSVETLSGGVTVLAIVAVNALGDVIDPETNRIIAGVRNASGKGFQSVYKLLKAGVTMPSQAPGHTTIGVIVTNARLNKEQANKVAQMAHDGLARTITPCHTMFDGDTLFALSCGEISADLTTVGAAGAEAMSRAVIRAVSKAKGICGVPAARDLFQNM
ncbi:MAG: P1 family peptidase [Chloroflexota bacterium]